MKTYLVPEINKKYTEVISDYIQNGYSIHTNTMGGSQGEKASIHLIAPDKKTILRISLESFFRWENQYADGYQIIIKEYSTDILHREYELDSMNDILWAREGKLIKTMPFFQISGYKKNFYGDKEAYDKAKAIRSTRYKGSILDSTVKSKDITSPKTIKIILPWVKRQPKCTSVIPRDISKVEKVTGNVWDSKTRCYQCKSYYAITLRNKTIRLGERPAS